MYAGGVQRWLVLAFPARMVCAGGGQHWLVSTFAANWLEQPVWAGGGSHCIGADGLDIPSGGWSCKTSPWLLLGLLLLLRQLLGKESSLVFASC